MQQVVDAINHPTAVIPVDRVLEVIQFAAPTSALINELDELQLLSDPFETAADTAGQAFEGRRLKVQGKVRLDAFCEPEVPLGPRSANDGLLSLELGVADTAIQREVGGDFQNCRIRGRTLATPGVPVVVRLTAPFAFDVGHVVSLRGARPLILDATFRFDAVHADVAVGDAASTPVDLPGAQFRFSRVGVIRTEVLVTLDPIGIPGTAVVITALDFVGVRDSQGLWGCGEAACSLVP
jgi:hypothetical protein